MATKKTTTKKAAPAKKTTVARKPSPKKATPTKKAAVAKKVAPKKATAKKTVAKKPAAKKAVAVKKAAAKKVVAKKPAPAKKAVAVKKAAAKKVVAKKPAPAKKAVAVKKAVVKKTVAKKAAPTKKAVAQKTTVKKAAPKKATAIKATTKKVAAQKPTKKTAVAKPVKTPKVPKAKKKKAPKVKTIKEALPTKISATKAATPSPAPEGRNLREEKKAPAVIAHRRMSDKTKKSKPSVTMTKYKTDGRSILDAPQEQTGPVYRYSDDELAEFKELITGRLESARKELTYLQGLITRKDEAGTEDTENRYMNMEDGSGAMEREQLAQLASRQIQFINHLEKALIRIENKTYGICRVTGKLIDKARLRAVPHATLSIEAKNYQTNK